MLQNYFIAILPPEPLLSKILNIKQHISTHYKSHGALQSPAHITLHMPFKWEEGKEEKLIETLQNFKTNTFFEINLVNYNCFKPRVVFIDVKKNDMLFEFQKNLVFHVKKNLSIFNQYENLRGFHPHITIAFRDLKKPNFYAIWEEFENKEFIETFACTELTLLKKEGDNWATFKTFPLKTETVNN